MQVYARFMVTRKGKYVEGVCLSRLTSCGTWATVDSFDSKVELAIFQSPTEPRATCFALIHNLI